VIKVRARTVETAVQKLSEYLIGQDPSGINDLWQTMYQGDFYRGGPILVLREILTSATALSLARGTLPGHTCLGFNRCRASSRFIGTRRLDT